jgi:DNA-binding SARP family transcriptional activator
VVVFGRGVEPDDQARIAAVVRRRRGVAAIVTADLDTARARLVLDGHGHGVLAGIAAQPIHVTAAGMPREVAAEVAVMLDHEHTPPVTDGDGRADGSSELIAELDDFIATDDDTYQLPVAARAHGAVFGDDTDDVDLDAAAGLLGGDPNEQAWERPRPAVLVRVLGCPAVPALPQLKELDKRLLVYLASQEGAPVSRGRVRDAVWAGSARETKTLSNHLSALRNALGNNQHGEPFLPTNGAGPLRLDPAVMTDLTVFKALVRRARIVASSESLALLRDALDLVEGEPFNAVGYEWAAVTQDGYQTHHEIVEAAMELYRLASDANDLATARFAVVQGSKAVPMHEELYRLRMQLEHRAANIAAVHAAFSELSEQLMMLDCAPSTETVSLYRQLVGKTTS